jgi:hypothetical protein
MAISADTDQNERTMAIPADTDQSERTMAILADTRGLSPTIARTGHGAHPAFYSVGTRDPFLGGVKRLGRESDLSPSI